MFFHMRFLFLFFASAVHCRITPPKVIFTYQSEKITFVEWFEMFTLCLAPLVAHIAGGVSAVTVLGSPSQKPSWTARLPHFNSISIIWRYYAIADRRVRALDWDKSDMAACNAVFWNGEKGRWDGSEYIHV